MVFIQGFGYYPKNETILTFYDLIGLSNYLIQFIKSSKQLTYESKPEVLIVCGMVQGGGELVATTTPPASII